MTTTKNKTEEVQAKSTKLEVIKSLAWLIEATFRGFVGWVLLSHFNNYVMVAAAIYSLITAGLIVITHFVKAHKA